jgi:hypothetical protein
VNPLSGGRTWWAHFEFTRINIELTILPKKIEEPRVFRASSVVGVPGCPDFPAGQGAQRALGDLAQAVRLDHDPHLHAEAAEHVDQRLDAEEMQPPAQEIAHAGLANLQQLRELRLLEPSRGRDLLDLIRRSARITRCSASCAQNVVGATGLEPVTSCV